MLVDNIIVVFCVCCCRALKRQTDDAGKPDARSARERVIFSAKSNGSDEDQTDGFLLTAMSETKIQL